MYVCVSGKWIPYLCGVKVTVSLVYFVREKDERE
jgi:hypothetical protein